MAEHSPIPWHYQDHVSPHLSMVAADGRQVTGPIYKDGDGVAEANHRLMEVAVSVFPELVKHLGDYVDLIKDPYFDCAEYLEALALLKKCEKEANDGHAQ